jgi:hypothetical protein
MQFQSFTLTKYLTFALKKNKRKKKEKDNDRDFFPMHPARGFR